MRFIETIFENKCENLDVSIPLRIFGQHDWFPIYAGKSFTFRNLDEFDIYARYDRITYTNSDKPPFCKVDAHVRSGWKVPKGGGLILVLENLHSQTLSVTISRESDSIAMPFGIPLFVYNVDPYGDLAEFAKFEVMPTYVETFENPDSLIPRKITRGGGIRRIRRSPKELAELKAERSKKNMGLTFESEEIVKDYLKSRFKKK